MRNLILDHYAATDINHPDPPLKLVDVRELLRLDKGYYSSADDSAVQEIVHKLTVAGQQVLTRPTILKDAIGKLGLKALLLPDRRRILIDSETPDLKQRWSEAHEIGHDLIPWHAHTMLGDNKSTLTPTCHEQVEAEANFAAGQLLFLQCRFQEEGGSLPLGFESVRKLSDRYQNTITTTLWRYIDQNPGLLVGAISDHPMRSRTTASKRNPLKHFIRSPKFAAQFSGVTESDVFRATTTYCENKNGGSLGSGEASLFDLRGERHTFHFETFFNGYEALTLGVHVGSCS